MAGLNTIGVTLSHKAPEASEFTEIQNVLEIPELGGDVDKIEVTTLKSTSHEYIDGLINNGDSIAIKCLYDTNEYKTVQALKGKNCEWKVEFPDGNGFEWSGTPSVKLDSVTVGGYLSYTVSIAPSSAVTPVVVDA